MAKLLMITGDRSLAGGKRGAFYNTLEEFHEYWERIDVICPNLKNQQVKEIFGNVFVHASPKPLIFQAGFISKKGEELFKSNEFDLMTVHEYAPFYNGIGARLLHSKIKVPYVLEIFHIPGYPKAGNFKEIIYKKATYLFARFDSVKSKAVRVMNNSVGQFLIKAGVPKDKIQLIPALYIDLEIFRPVNLKKEYDLIFIGRLEKNKGLDLFLECVRKTGLKAVIVGDGPLKDYCESIIENWKLRDRVLLYGWAKDSREIAELMNKSMILVAPSYNEGGPRVVAEAMACGVPVLATPVGIVPDLLKNGLGGEVIVWDSEDIARKAKSLLNDPSRYIKYSNEAIKLAAQFDRKTTIKNYAEKLLSIIK